MLNGSLGFSKTVIVVVAVIVPSSLDIVIVVVPVDKAVMMPLDMVATDSSLLVHIGLLILVFSGVEMVFKVVLSPT